MEEVKFKYKKIKNKEIIITGLKTKNAIRIDIFAFDNCRSIREIHFPYSVKSIGNAVVSGCSGLKSITYYDTTKITNVTFSDRNKKILTVFSE